MSRSFGWLFLILALPGCREALSDRDHTRRPDVANRTGSAELSDSEPGVEFEAPRLIPAVRAQMAAIAEPSGRTEENLTAFKNGVGTLVNAMEADLNRMGVTDTGEFWSRSDSLMREFGSGAGTVAELPPQKVDQVIPQVEQLMAMYQERMRAAP
jgi:hypothetical protein